MTSETPPSLSLGGAELPSRGWLDLFGRFFRLSGGFWGRGNWRARGLVVGLVVLTMAQVVIQVALNIWTEQFFDAFGTKSMSGFLVLAATFALVLIANLVVTVSHLRMRRSLQITWRQWLTRRLAGEWMASGRHYRMTYLEGDHDNPDGRISEDIRIATEVAVDLGHSLLYCIMLLASFVHILWLLSGPAFVAGELEIYLPGHLVWIALAYTAVGVSVALMLGPPLVTTAEARQTYEANFRFGLVRARENSSAIAMAHSESGERRRFGGLLQDVVAAWQRQTDALFRFYIFSSSWSVLSPVFPILVAAPRYIAGTITLGVLMQIAQAFQQAVSALSWPIDNLSHAAEWRASAERILGLHDGIVRAKRIDWCLDCGRIEISGATSPALTFHEVTVVNPGGQIAIDGLSLTVGRGEHVWLCSEPSATTAIVRVLSGLWMSGRGRIALPNDGSLYIMPQKPYLPTGPLREVVTYPAAADADQDDQIRMCLRQVGLGHLNDRLQDSEIWETSLTIGEQQRLGFARLLFHRPNWIVLEDPADALSAAEERQMMQLLQTEFSHATLIVLGGSAPSGLEWKRMALSAPRQAVSA